GTQHRRPGARRRGAGFCYAMPLPAPRAPRAAHRRNPMALTQPRTPPGMHELLPREQIALQRMLDTIRANFERYAFVPVETPAMEFASVLLTKEGGETERQVYFVQSSGALEQGEKPELA